MMNDEDLVFVVYDLDRRTPTGEAWRVATFARRERAEAFAAIRPSYTIHAERPTRSELALVRD